MAMQPPDGFTRHDLLVMYRADCEKAGRTLPYPVSCRTYIEIDKTDPEKPKEVKRLKLTYPDATFTPAQSKAIPTGTVTGSYLPVPVDQASAGHAARFVLAGVEYEPETAPSKAAQMLAKARAADYGEWCRKNGRKKAPKPKKTDE